MVASPITLTKLHIRNFKLFQQEVNNLFKNCVITILKCHLASISCKILAPLPYCSAERSEVSLTSFETASRDVIPRHASAEGPLACARGDKKLGSGRQKV
jgi:hypothetical protein